MILQTQNDLGIRKIIFGLFFIFESISIEDDQGHLVKSLKDIENSLKTDFSDTLNDCIRRLEKMAVAEKLSWNILDSIVVNCETMKQQMETHADKSVCIPKIGNCPLLAQWMIKDGQLQLPTQSFDSGWLAGFFKELLSHDSQFHATLDYS